MKRTPWLPLDANFQDDAAILGISAEAELVFLRSLAMAKRLDTGGVIVGAYLRRLCDKIRTDGERLVDELVDAGLWIDDDDRYVITGWTDWNVSLSESHARKARGAKLGNHRRHGHDGELDDCQICYPNGPDGSVSPASSLGLAKRPVSESHSDRSTSRMRSQIRQDKTRQDDTRPDDNEASEATSRSRAEGKAEAAAVALADRLFEIIGLTDPADRGWQRRVGRALHNGWTADQIEDLAHDAFATADNPKAYLKTCIDGKANTKPEPEPVNGSGGGGGGGRVNEADLAWATVTSLIAREGAQSFLTVAEHTGCLDPIALKAATDVRQIIRYQDQVSAKIAFRNAYNAAATQGATT